MKNAKLVVNVLLVATIFSTAYHQALPIPTSLPVDFRVFLLEEGTAHPLAHATQDSLVASPQPFEEFGPSYTVTATAYQAVETHTDDEPFVTADNSFIKPGYSSKLHWLAISRDLLVHWGGRIKYGDHVCIQGVSPGLDGLYTVHDTMNKRHHHCIDILSNPEEKLDIFTKGVKIHRVRATSRVLLAARRPATQPWLASRSLGHPGSTGRTRRRFVQPAEQINYLTSAIL